MKYSMLFALLSLAASAAAFILGAYVLHKDSKSTVNRVFMALCYSVALWAFFEFLYRQAPTAQSAAFWLRVSAIWPLTQAILLHFVLVFTEHTRLLRHKLTYALIYVPALAIAAMDFFTPLISVYPIRAYWGWTFDYAHTDLADAVSFYTLAIVLLSLALCVAYYLKLENPRKKRGAGFVAAGLAAPIVVGLVTDLIFPWINVEFPEMGAVTFGFGTAGLIAYAIARRQLFAVTPATAAENILSRMSDVLLLTDPDGVILTANHAASLVLRYSQGELMGRQVSTILAEETLSRLPTSGTVSDAETLLVTKEGARIPVSLSRSPTTGDGRERVGMIWLARDVTDQKRAEQALRDSEERYRTLVEAAPDAIAVQVDGKLVYANPATATLLGGSSTEEIVGRPVLDFTPPGLREPAIERMTRASDSGPTPTRETRYMRLDGRTIDVELAMIPTTYQGKPGTQAIFRDITERKQIEQMKTDFVAMVSHELRTPLTVILGNAEVLERFTKPQDLPKTCRRSVQTIRHRGALMVELIESLLDLSQIQAGTFALTTEPADLGDLLKRVTASVPVVNGHRLTLDVTEDLPEVTCDARRLATALTNLVGNAIKFSPDGGEVRVAARTAKDSVQVSVTDEGVGITPENAAKIFDRFTQADMSTTRSFQGVGLGLYITKKIVDAHGGTIAVESKPGKGSTFTIELPLVAAPPVQAA